MSSQTQTDLERQGAAFARQYIESRGYEGDTETQVWHILMDLLCLCKAENIDLDKVLADVRAEAPLVLNLPR